MALRAQGGPGQGGRGRGGDLQAHLAELRLPEPGFAGELERLLTHPAIVHQPGVAAAARAILADRLSLTATA